MTELFYKSVLITLGVLSGITIEISAVIIVLILICSSIDFLKKLTGKF